MKPPRLTIRRLMILVALAGAFLAVGLWMARRAASFRVEGVRHRRVYFEEYPGMRGGVLEGDATRAEHHRKLSVKYERAARSPWWPVEPDPPEPEAVP